MKRIPVSLDLERFPVQFHSLLADSVLYDSSCSPDARVYFIDKEEGYYLKTAARDALKTEAMLTEFLHSKHLATEVLAYENSKQDWLLTRRVPGEDCTHRQYLDNPKRLCETLAHLLRTLHDTDTAGCPIPDHRASYLATAEQNYQAGRFDLSYFSDGNRSVQDAWAVVQNYASSLKNDTLLHGDYCLPNIMLANWQFSGFIDVGRGGVGDRHVDLYWGAWTLQYNLKTDAWRDHFLDAYGRDRIDPELLNAIGAFEVFG